MSFEAKEKLLRYTSPADLRMPVLVLLLGGALLVIMAQGIYADVARQSRWPLYLLMFIGLAAFALAVHLIARRRPPRWLVGPGKRMSRFFGVFPGQLILLSFAPCFSLMASLAAGEKLEALDFPISMAAWFVAIGAAVAGGYRPDPGLLRRLDRRELLLVTALFLVAFLLRAIAIDALPTTVSGDEASSGLVAVKFLNGEANNPFTVGWFSFPSLYFAVQSLGILFLDQTVAGLRIMSAVAGALTVVAVYLFARTLFGRLAAFLAALFLAAFHYHIHFSRLGLNNIWDGLFVVITMAGLWHGWKSGRRLSFLISGLALGLGMYFYVSLRILPVLLLVWALFALVFDRPKFKRRFGDLLLLAFVALVVALPLLLFYQQHPDEFNAPLQRVTIFNGWLEGQALQSDEPPLKIVWQQIVDSALGFTHLPLRDWYNPGSPLLLAGAAGLFLLGLLWAITAANLGYLLLLLPLLAVVVLGGLSQNSPAAQRYIIAAPMAAILVVVPLAESSRWLRQSWPRYSRFFLLGPILVMVWISASDLRYYFFEVYDNYVLGGVNTEVATSVAHFLEEKEPPQSVYFFGFPRMGYYSLSTIPYLVPEADARDVLEPITDWPEGELSRPTTFVFLPERENELAYVRDAYPQGTYRQIRNENGLLLFVAYDVPLP